MARETVIYLLGRDTWQKDASLMRVLVSHLKQYGHKIVWEDPAARLIYKWRRVESRVKWLPAILVKANLRTVQLLYGLTHWGYFSYLRHRKNGAIDARCNNLRAALSKIIGHSNVIVVSRSSGGRIASLVADELGINHIMCLSYPFRHPDKEIEPERFTHLEHLKTPMLIVQGTRDEYGGLEAVPGYALSSSIELLFVDATHAFKLNEQDWQHLLGRIGEIIHGQSSRRSRSK